jgi:hypothetical protein
MPKLFVRSTIGLLSLGDKCAYCQEPGDTWDHIIPRSKGGPDAYENLVPCCLHCNTCKGDRTPDYLGPGQHHWSRWWARYAKPRRRNRTITGRVCIEGESVIFITDRGETIEMSLDDYKRRTYPTLRYNPASRKQAAAQKSAEWARRYVRQQQAARSLNMRRAAGRKNMSR